MTKEEIKKYSFNYFTGYGYREISAHTIQIYPITVRALNFNDAVQKLNKKLRNVSKYNNCFDSKGTIQVLEEFNKTCRVGLYWIEDNVVKWEGDMVYYKPSVFGNVNMQSFNLPSVESHYGSWIKDYCTGRITYSYVGWIKYSLDRFDYTKSWSTASKEEQKREYKKYIIDEIQYLLNSKHCPVEDKVILKTFKLLE